MAIEWRDVALEEVADELTVGYVGPMASEYVDEGIPFLRSLNVEPLRINKNDLKFITPEFHQRIQKSRLAPGDVVIVRTGKPGACSVVPEWLANANCSDLVIVRCGKQLNNRYLAYYVNTAASGHVAAHLVGAVQQHFNVGSARTLRLNLPPLAEQKAIVSVLGALDDKIELNRRMNETLEGLARAIFQSWFVDFDPVRAKRDGIAPPGLTPEIAAFFPDSFEDSDLGPIPRNWTIRRLEDLTTHIGSGATPRGGSSVYVDHGVALVRSQNVYDNEFRWDGLARMTPEAAKALDGVTLEANDILFNITGASILRTCVVDTAALPARVNQHVARIRAKPFVSARFLHLHLVRQEMKEHLMGFNAGATREAVTKGHLQAIRLITPPDNLFRAFDAFTAPMYSQKQTNLDQTKSLAALRDALLPKLLSGELRVAEAERTFEEPR